MKGIFHLRKFLEMTGEEFGALVDVNKTTVSRWQDENVTIPKKAKMKVQEVFDCPIELIDKMVNDTEILELKKVATRYLNKSAAKEITDSYEADSEFVRNCAVDSVIWDMKNHPLLPEKVKEFCDFWKFDREVANILLVAAARYTHKGGINQEVGRKSDYYSGLIREDDPLVNIISLALEAALGKK